MDELVNTYLSAIVERKFEFIVEHSFLPVVTDIGFHKVIKLDIEDGCLDLHNLHQTVEDLFIKEEVDSISIERTLSSIGLTESILATNLDRKDHIGLGDQYSIKNSSPEREVSIDVRVSYLPEDLFMASDLFDLRGTFLIDRTYSSPYVKLADEYLKEVIFKYLDFIQKFKVFPIFGADNLKQPINHIIDLDSRKGWSIWWDVDFIELIRNIFRYLRLRNINTSKMKEYVDYVSSVLNFIPDRTSTYKFSITRKDRQEKVEGSAVGFGLFRYLLSWYSDSLIQEIIIKSA